MSDELYSSRVNRRSLGGSWETDVFQSACTSATHQSEVSAQRWASLSPNRNRIRHLKPQIVRGAGTWVIYSAALPLAGLTRGNADVQSVKVSITELVWADGEVRQHTGGVLASHAISRWHIEPQRWGGGKRVRHCVGWGGINLLLFWVEKTCGCWRHEEGVCLNRFPLKKYYVHTPNSWSPALGHQWLKPTQSLLLCWCHLSSFGSMKAWSLVIYIWYRQPLVSISVLANR